MEDAPQRDVVQEVEEVAQDAEVALRQHAGEHQHGGAAVLLRGELLGLQQGLVQLRRDDGLGQVPEELLHQAGHVAGQGGGQALLARVQLDLNNEGK